MTDIVLYAQHFESVKTCLTQIRLYTDAAYRVLLVLERGQTEMEAWFGRDTELQLVWVDSPSSVADAYNAGARHALSSHIVFMRDHALVSEGWLEKLLACMDSYEDAAFVGPVSNGVSGPQGIPVSLEDRGDYRSLSKGLDMIRSGQSQFTVKLLSFLMLAKREVFERIGGFDPRYTLEGYEDDDLCYRALLSGYGLYLAMDCLVRCKRDYDLYPDRPGWYDSTLAMNRERAHQKWGKDLLSSLYGWERSITISLCMIVKNEEATLDRCLSSVWDITDEIIIVDTGSEDRTKEIASKYTDKINDFAWIQDFAAARNYAFSLATQSYILWLDADDVLLPGDAEQLRALKGKLPWNIDAVSMNYNLAADEYGNVTYSLRRNRLVKRENGFQWIGAVHEYLSVQGHIHHSPIHVTHARKHERTRRNLEIYEQREADGQWFPNRDVYYYGNECFDHSLWERALHLYERFLAESGGNVDDKITACGKAGDCLSQLGRYREAREKILQSFLFGIPQVENCCRLGYFHMQEQLYREAAYWYETAIRLDRLDTAHGFVNHACWTWLPHLQLSVCYDKLGQIELACRHNEIAASFIPGDSRVLSNRRYFESHPALVMSASLA